MQKISLFQWKQGTLGRKEISKEGESLEKKQRGRQLDSLYIPLIIAIPANIIIVLQMMIASWETSRGLILYAIFTFFLLATGFMAFRRKDQKSKTFGGIYLAAGIIFILLIFFVI